MPVRPRIPTPPGCVAVFITSAPLDVVCSDGVDGDAEESTPAGLNTPATVFESALIAPTLGSCWYMIRHVTPVANAEMAIGRNTKVLKTTAQRTRSVNTAKINPSAVTNAGTTAT